MLKHSQIHTLYPNDKEDEEGEDGDLVEEDEENEDLIEANYCNGNNEVVKTVNHNCYMF